MAKRENIVKWTSIVLGIVVLFLIATLAFFAIWYMWGNRKKEIQSIESSAFSVKVYKYPGGLGNGGIIKFVADGQNLHQREIAVASVSNAKVEFITNEIVCVSLLSRAGSNLSDTGWYVLDTLMFDLREPIETRKWGHLR